MKENKFNIGEICKIVGINPSNYDVSNSKGGNWYVLAEDMELVQSKPSFDLHTSPWYIRVENEEQFNLANEWLKENFGSSLIIQYDSDVVGMTNTDSYTKSGKHLMWIKEKHLTGEVFRHEVKLNFKTIISSVEYPVVAIETEQQKRIRELKETIDSASKQLEELMKETK